MKGSFMKFFERPIFCVLFAAFVILYGYTLIQYLRGRKKQQIKQ